MTTTEYRLYNIGYETTHYINPFSLPFRMVLSSKNESRLRFGAWYVLTSMVRIGFVALFLRIIDALFSAMLYQVTHPDIFICDDNTIIFL
jgi:hypothetical protein